MLKISVIGQDTLAEAIATCCARHFEVLRVPCSSAKVWWLCWDTPIGDGDKPDSTWVMDRIRELLVDAEPGPLILTSSQMPVGTTAALEKEFPEFAFAHSPENIRVATAVQDFECQARIVVGVRNVFAHTVIKELMDPFTKQLILTDPETAECCKHFTNCLLALCIVY